MEKGNIIYLIAYRNRVEKSNHKVHQPVSKELERAIKHLIYRMRELGPIPHSK